MQLKRRVFRAMVWAKRMAAFSTGLSEEEKEALKGIEKLPDDFRTQRTAHEAAMQADCEAFFPTLEGLSDPEKKGKHQTFWKEMQNKNQAFLADMKVQQQAAFSCLNEVREKEGTQYQVLNKSCETMEALSLLDARGVMAKGALHNNLVPRKVFLASLQELSKEEKKLKWQERQAAMKGEKEEILNKIAIFQASLDGLSLEEKREKWQARVAELHSQFVAARGSTDATATLMARMKWNQTRRAKKQAMQKARRINQKRFKPSDESKEELEAFIANIEGLSDKERKTQWRNHIQQLRDEVQKAQMIVAMTRRARRANLADDTLKETKPVLNADVSGIAGEKTEAMYVLVEKEIASHSE